MDIEDLAELSFEEPWPNLIDNDQMITPLLLPRVMHLIRSARGRATDRGRDEDAPGTENANGAPPKARMPTV